MSDSDSLPTTNVRWHITRGVPLSLIMTIASVGIGQIMAVMYWAAGVSTRLTVVEEYMKATQPQAAQIAVIQEKVSNLQGVVNRMDEWLRHNVTTKNQSP